MFDDLGIFKTASSLARHSAARQSLVAQNIANADTPGYDARDLVPFADAFQKTDRRIDGMALRTSRALHMDGGAPRIANVVEDTTTGNTSPNGNSVSLESEMVKASTVKQTHELALATYRGGLDLLRTAMSSGG